MEEEKFKTPTETIELPSKGLVYPKDSELSKRVIEMKYMTAKEEDILLNPNYIKNGTAIDKLLKAMIVTPIEYNELIVGDKNAIMVAARILGYGSEYVFEYNGEEHSIDLSQINPKPFDEKDFTQGVNEFPYTFPFSKTEITFKLLTHSDEQNISRELEGLKKINKDFSPELSTRMKYMITSVGNSREPKVIREFVDNHLLARDSKSLRGHIKKIQPDVDLTFFPTGDSIGVNIPIGLKFFWPDFE
jgi:hypothetical protein